jgi:hypothetical protein
MDKRTGKKKKSVKVEIKEPVLPNQQLPITPPKKTNVPQTRK